MPSSFFRSSYRNPDSTPMPAVRSPSSDEEQQWVLFIKDELEGPKHGYSSRLPSIFMASSPLRGLKLEAFIPQVVSIGPYHYDLGPHHSYFPDGRETERYKAIAASEMEKHKVVASRKVAKTFRDGDFCALAREFLKDIEFVRSQYDTDLGCKLDEKLAYMLALDAAFVVEVLRSSVRPDYRSGFCAYYWSRFPRPLRKSILQDFVLLENQIPLFLLLKVISMAQDIQSESEAEKTLASLVGRLADDVLPFHALSEDSISFVLGDIRGRKHLLDCLYGMMTHGTTSVAMVEIPTHFPRALDLYNCGIKFRPMVPGNTMSIKFDSCRGILYLPKIKVGDDTEKLFRNLIAYESHLVDNVHVLSYLRFMNSLVDTPEDVAILVEKNIISQDIGSNEEVARMWNNLCVNTMRACSEDYEDVAVRLVKHCQHRTNAWKAEFKRLYLAKPWLVVSVLSAGALLIMTFVIMYYTIKLYLKPGG